MGVLAANKKSPPPYNRGMTGMLILAPMQLLAPPGESRHEPWEQSPNYPPPIVRLYQQLERQLTSCHPSRRSVLDSQGRRGRPLTPDEKSFARRAKAIEANYQKFLKQQAKSAHKAG